MTLSDDLEVDCCEEELSEAQVNFYSNAIKEYEKALSEANQIKKGSSVTKTGNVWLVKSTYLVKVRNPVPPATQLPPLVGQHSLNNPRSGPNLFMVRPPIPTAPPLSTKILVSTNQSSISTPITQEGTPTVVNEASLPVVEETPFPASQLLSQFTVTTAKKQKPAPLSHTPETLQVSQVVHSSHPPIVTQVTNSAKVIQIAPTVKVSHVVQIPKVAPASQAVLVTPSIQLSGNAKKANSNPSPNATKPNKPPDAPTVPAPVQSNQLMTAVTLPSNPPPPAKSVQKESGHTSEDPKLLSKTIPSLCVVVRPANAVPDAVNAKKREALDSFVKSRLVLDGRRFAEWLMQVGLLRSQQFGLCRTHCNGNPTPVPLQLRMYAEENKFPYSGGYVWISKCCDRNFVSIFRESIFEDAAHSPTVLLKLIYHWACQTTVANVVQWVKIDHPYLRLFYTMLRSVCTVEVHTSTPLFGSKNGRVEVGVISLGTTSTDGKRRDVKVEVLGVYDQETKKLRLRACEPIVGDTRSRARFTKILEPLPRWVNQKSVIMTDFTVDRTALEELGFHHVVQKNLNTVPADDRLNNRTVMDYLRKTVPKVFQNTLSLLSTATIQQFLDELIWREINGQSSSDAFHNIIRDISAQARADTGVPLVKRLPIVSVDPFKDWSINQTKANIHNTVSSNETIITSSGAMKRPISSTSKDASAASGASNPKEARSALYYATMSDSGKEATSCDPKEAETAQPTYLPCQHANCHKVTKSNLEMMMHLRQHLVEDSVSDGKDWKEHCSYCLDTLATVGQKKGHEEIRHTFLSSFSVQKSREDVATVKDIICLICHERFVSLRLLDHHLEKTHVYCEMPYRCRVCQFQTSVHSQLIDHFYDNHKKSLHLLCPLCLDTFDTKGDNLAKGFDTGHLQYLQHLKNHLPLTNGHTCKRCVLTFQQYDQLRYHVRTDHTSAVANAQVRPFSYTVIKPNSNRVMQPASQQSQTMIQSNPSIMTILPLSSDLMSPISDSCSQNTSASGSGIKSGVRTYSKDFLQDIPNTSVARRLPNVILTDDMLLTVNLCIECKEPLKKKNHFTGYMCCTLCRFSTCCCIAMKQHQNHVHKGKSGPILGSVYALSEAVKCKCGFSSTSGLELERHLVHCGEKSVIVAP
ncbi:uncharacterized protein LOC130696250 isoform X2 [Daphnia carinata]|uniref:uncharacterized protein LOC130696250 isoform X2 n=1 Tax=Daphnia carinata TaxID=120202 RepID=UPI00257EB3A4|nr:uncharacterized protein LOC130696250 isoform X2 [Daphnia carinata]